MYREYAEVFCRILPIRLSPISVIFNRTRKTRPKYHLSMQSGMVEKNHLTLLSFNKWSLLCVLKLCLADGYNRFDHKNCMECRDTTVHYISLYKMSLQPFEKCSFLTNGPLYTNCNGEVLF
jgi:hypothetical protein